MTQSTSFTLTGAVTASAITMLAVLNPHRLSKAVTDHECSGSVVYHVRRMQSAEPEILLQWHATGRIRKVDIGRSTVRNHAVSRNTRLNKLTREIDGLARMNYVEQAT